MSKTQLQTNNTKLSALITELQGKADGGGIQIARGTVTISETTTVGAQIATVTGLPFSPKFVLVYYDSPRTVHTSNNEKHDIFGYDSQNGISGGGFVSTTGWSTTATCNTTSSTYSFDIAEYTADGFVLTSGNSLFASGKYTYVAIG